MNLLSTEHAFAGLFPCGKSIITLNNFTDEKGARKARKQGRVAGAEVSAKKYWNKYGAIQKNKADAIRYTQNITQTHGTLSLTVALFVNL
jgi:hypothetical protein